MKYTKDTQIIEDEIYWNKTPKGKAFIDRAGKNNECTKSMINIGSGKYYSVAGNATRIYLTHCRLATYEERNWLIACEEAKEFIPLKKVKPKTYEIY